MHRSLDKPSWRLAEQACALPLRTISALGLLAACGLATGPARADTTIFAAPTTGLAYGVGAAILGDLNGDGYSEIAIGTPAESGPSGPSSGYLRIYSGRDFTLLRVHANPVATKYFGSIVRALPDVDGDGRPDYLVTAADPSFWDFFLFANPGRTWAFSGATGNALYSVLNGAWDVTVVPDVTGDGIADVACSGTSSVPDFSDWGQVSVYNGATGALYRAVNAPSSQYSFANPSDIGARFGASIAGGSTQTGAGYVLVGNPSASFLGTERDGERRSFFPATSALTPPWRWNIPQTALGIRTLWIPDITGDGEGEQVVTAGFNEFEPNFPPLAYYTAIYHRDGGLIRFLATPANCPDFGRMLADAGDADGDGKHDILVGSPRAQRSGGGTGRVFLFSSATGNLIREIATPESAATGYGTLIDASRDINGDGERDLLVSADNRVFVWRTVPNDACSLFAIETVGDGVHAFTTVGAQGSGSLGDACLSSGSSTIYNDIWFQYQASCTGTLEVSTCGAADFDTRLAVYEGCSFEPQFLLCTLGPLLACNDDAKGCAGFTSRIEMPVSAGQCLRIRVGGFSSTTEGRGNLTIACSGACGADLDANGVVNASDLALLLAAWGTPAGDVNGDQATNASDIAALLGAWGPCS